MQRTEFFDNGRLIDKPMRDMYNRFLRNKVFAMLYAMTVSARQVRATSCLRTPTTTPVDGFVVTVRWQGLFDFAMMLDADTAVNTANVAKLVAALPGAGDAPVFTGRCLQQSLQDAPRTGGAPPFRRDIASFIDLHQRRGDTVQWPLLTPPSPGGGPGLLFSRGLLASIHDHLPACRHLTAPLAFGDSVYSGGDSMLTRCFALLGVRCHNERDLHLDVPGQCPFQSGCSLTSLFRKNPPWFYKALHAHLARKVVPGLSANLEEVSPLEEVISFHHVKPSSRLDGTGPDPRCAVRLRSDPQSRAGWWGSFCMPNFVFIGAPLSGARSLLQALESHPEVVLPKRRSLQIFGTRQARKLNWSSLAFADRATRAASWTPPDALRARAIATHLRRAYATSFPSIDPRDFKLTGEASGSYAYHEGAPTFFAHPHFARLQLVVILRQPTARCLTDFMRQRVGIAAPPLAAAWHIRDALADAQALRRACGMAALHAACPSCPPPAVSGETISASKAQNVQVCSATLRSMQANAGQWRALWRSWYHTFLPRWLRFRERLLVLFSDDLQDGGGVTAAIQKLSNLLQLQPPLLTAPSWLTLQPSDVPESAPSAAVAHRFNVTEEVVVAVRELTADSGRLTDQLLLGDGRRGVPWSWKSRRLTTDLKRERGGM